MSNIKAIFLDDNEELNAPKNRLYTLPEIKFFKMSE